jgi:tryptophan-rich sensory protein
MGRRAWLGLAGFLIACYGTAAWGSRFSPGPWYEELVKPLWTPPGSTIGLVWTVLYGVMAVAAWLVWRTGRGSERATALGLFALQLALNGAWSWVFFGLQNPGLALLDIGALWFCIVATLVAFWRVHAGAAALLLPYLAWVSFAAVLNFEIWRLNA